MQIMNLGPGFASEWFVMSQSMLLSMPHIHGIILSMSTEDICTLSKAVQIREQRDHIMIILTDITIFMSANDHFCITIFISYEICSRLYQMNIFSYIWRSNICRPGYL